MTRGGRALATLATVLFLVACGGDDDDTSNATVPPEGTTEPTSTTDGDATTTTEDPDAAVKADIEQAYYDQWDAFIEIFGDPNPSNPLIERHFAELQRERLLDSIAEFTQNGTALRPPQAPDDFSSSIVAIDARRDEATVEACVVDSLVVVDQATGEVVDDDVTTLELTIDFRLIDGHWKVTNTERTNRREGVHPCGSS